MSDPTPRIPGIRQQQCAVNDADETTLISSVAASLAYAEVWAVTRAGAARRIGRTTEGAIGKVDSAGVTYFQDGTVRLWASAADVGGGGATSHTVWFDFPDQVKPLPPAAVDKDARWQATKATEIAKAALESATAASHQATAATNIAKLALTQNDAQELKIAALDVRVHQLETV